MYNVYVCLEFSSERQKKSISFYKNAVTEKKKNAPSARCLSNVYLIIFFRLRWIREEKINRKNECEHKRPFFSVGKENGVSSNGGDWSV